MDAIMKFKTDLEGWLTKHGFEKLGFVWDEDYAYGIDSHTIRIGVQAFPEISQWFEEFLVKNGCHYSDILDPVKCFLHELGHHETIYQFTDTELEWFNFFKTYDDDSLDEREFLEYYWRVKDEWAANKWAIDFINNNIDAVCELINIYCNDWNEIVYNYDVFELVGQPL